MTMLDCQFDSFDQYEVDDLEDDIITSDQATLDDFQDKNLFVINTKNAAEGAETLEDVVDMLRHYADFIESLDTDGYVLSEPIFGGRSSAFLPGE